MSKFKKTTLLGFCIKLDAKFPGKYHVIGEYIDASTPIAIQHIRCGCVKDYKPSYLLFNGSPCRIHEEAWNKITQEQFVININNRFGTRYEILDTYTGSHNKITIKHTLCGCTETIIANILTTTTPRLCKTHKMVENHHPYKLNGFHMDGVPLHLLNLVN